MSKTKIAVPNTMIRSGYYKTSDGLYSLISAICRTDATSTDPELLKALNGLETTFGNVYKALEKYNWD
jgi:translation initiation factor 2 alpha subunit (eIF-2alpha)